MDSGSEVSETGVNSTLKSGSSSEESQQPDSFRTVLQMIKERAVVAGLNIEEEWDEHHDIAVVSFVNDPKQEVLYMYKDPYIGFCVKQNIEPFLIKQLCYFIRREGVEQLTCENFLRSVYYGSVSGGYIESLHRTMSIVHTPRFFQFRDWPETVKNDFSAQLHRFMANLIDTRHKLDDKTVLYMPFEGGEKNILDPTERAALVEQLAQDKEYVNRMEACVIHWTRQVKDLLSSKGHGAISENAGPLEEIEYWKNRCADLAGVRKQLESPMVLFIIDMLAHAKSDYVTTFKKQASELKMGSKQAETNYRFVSVLKESCHHLAEATPSEIPTMMPKILKTLRIIWVTSEFYNTVDLITGFLQKLSNEIIKRCCESINIDKVFQGYVISSRKTLNTCIDCCTSWEEVYDKTASIHHKFSGLQWNLDRDAVLSQVNGFIQRCKNLLEVCEAQEVFARFEDGYQKPMPQFGGRRGLDIVRSLKSVETLFDHSMKILAVHKRSILDVRSTTWHEDFSKFRKVMKDLEIMIQNLLLSIFETVTTVEQGIEILDVFMHFENHESVKRTIEKKTVDVFTLVKTEINAVSQELSIKGKALTHQQPKFAGASHRVRALKRRVEKIMTIIDRAFFLPSVGSIAEIRASYRNLCHGCDEHIRRLNFEWISSVDSNISKLLEFPVLCRSTEVKNKLDVNLKGPLLKLFRELDYWLRLSYDVHHYFTKLYYRRDDLLELREYVLLVVRDYNRIISALGAQEMGLFREKLKFLDRRLYPGLTKLRWSSRDAIAMFITESRVHASKLQIKVDEFMDGNIQIMSLCVQISEQLLIKIEKNKLYEHLSFEKEQKQHRSRVASKIESLIQSIVHRLSKTYGMFSEENDLVQNHWYRYTVQQDNILEEALRLNVKRSLLELAKAIIGDRKSIPEPIFKVNLVLERNKIEFSPYLQHLKIIVHNLWVDCVDVIASFKRLPEILNRKTVDKEPLFKCISKCKEAKRIQNAILAGMEANAQTLMNYITVWDNYREIWEINKDAFIHRYRKLKPTVASFEADIARYTEVANNIEMNETVLNIQFVLLDCNPLKLSLLAHCQEWQKKFTNLLLEMATAELKSVNNYLVSMGKRITAPPVTLDEFAESTNLMEQLMAEKSLTFARFDPLSEQFSILHKYEVAVSPSMTEMHLNLPDLWQQYEQQLAEAEAMMARKRVEFKKGLLQESEDFKKATQDALHEFAVNGPFTSAISPQDALATIAQMRAHLNALREEEARLRKGLGMFSLDLPLSKEIQQLERDLDAIEGVWLLAAQWDDLWNQWKGGGFSDLKVADMDDACNIVFKKITKYSKELKEKNWEIVEMTRARVDQFRRTVPLITDLKNKAMRLRHWDEIMGLLDIEFDPNSDEFTLEFIVQHGFDKFANVIGDISSAATKELQIEVGLANISSVWLTNEYDMMPYKDRGHYKFRTTDNVFTSLEENQVSLTTMKASRFVKPFAAEVDYWEKILSQILEMTEMLLLVQRLWMYMENIFLGEDIRKQLPQETAEFDDINQQWRKITRKIKSVKIVKTFCEETGMMAELQQMNLSLERIQKALDMFLETKRMIFPRFYFISNDDLLEILGNTKNPENIQPHMKKLFDNIKSLKITCERDKWKVAGMTSSEGEHVPFEKFMYIDGPVESWLCEIEQSMRWTLKEVLKNTRQALKKMLSKRDKWIKDWPGQLCITASQIQWTWDVTRALIQVKETGERHPLKRQKKKEVKMLSKFSEAIRGNLTKNQRNKIVALVTIEVHARDIVEKLYKSGCKDVNAFDWMSQLRLYWDKELDDCVVRQTNTHFQYGYEYLGNSGRLVITPLTDRCYMTLTTALHLHRGGSPKGPAGTGKTETTKDLGKALGMYVIVINCSDGLDYKSMGRMFAGLAQTGAWGCFDEFNRINIEVLSVVAQQILQILSALSANQDHFVFEGHDMNIVWSCGLFITMNPGYAGRTELPDNLKSMFRPIAMVVPDCNLICEILLFAEGFDNTKVLAKKVFTLYSLAVQQLSRQNHYDFALRAIVSVLRYSGKKKRANPNMSDEELIVLSMKDMNVPKLTSADLPLFNGIMLDLFPGVEVAAVDYTVLGKALEKELRSQKLQVTPHAVTKIIQLYETKMSRHSVMSVGSTQAAKSVSWHILQAAMTNLCLGGDNNFQVVKDFPLNPKALSLAELYGEFDLSTNEWSDGVLSSVMRNTCSDDKLDEKWIVFDGPVDTLWIESMNSVMDDNKILTLINGERINMPDQVSLLFEIEDLAVASPATVSRAGMVFADYVDMGWKPYVESWLETKDTILAEEVRNSFNKWLLRTQKFQKENCKELIPIAELNGVASLCKLFDALGTVENGVDPLDSEYFPKMVDMCFLFCMIWSVCASVDEAGRKRIDNFVRELEGSIPHKDTVYEYFVDSKAKTWSHWEDKIKGGWKYNPAVPFFQQIVPTVDTVRYQFLMKTLVNIRCPIMLVGPVGTGKTSVAESTLRSIDASVFNVLTVNMSAQTSSNQVQDLIESRVEKRTKGVFVPIGGRKLITFMDDFNMPAKDAFGSQPPLELIRLWIDYGFWYDRQNQTTKKILDMLLITGMGPPGGGRMIISRRLQSRFNLINMTFPQESQIGRIFGTMLEQKLQDFDEDVKPIGTVMTAATIELYNVIVQKFLPTPAKIHYLFNLRDISRVFQGLLRADKKVHYSKDSLTRLWIHECFRVFSDRLINSKDREMFVTVLSEKLGSMFDQSYHSICPNRIPPIFGNLLSDLHEVHATSLSLLSVYIAMIKWSILNHGMAMKITISCYLLLIGQNQQVIRENTNSTLPPFLFYPVLPERLSELSLPGCCPAHLIIGQFCPIRTRQTVEIEVAKRVMSSGDYMNADLIYEDITDANKLKSCMTNFLDVYNNTPGIVAMDLVLFRDAIEHVSKVVRVIRQPRGNMLMIGIGGSGRQSLTRLAAFICEYKTFSIEVTKNYRKQEFRDDIKQLYNQCGVENRSTVFIFNDIQVIQESFLEDINNILSSGEVPSLYKADEFEEVKNSLADETARAGIEDTTQNVFDFLINRVRTNLHVVLCMSPVGEAFRNRIRMYPALVNCTTIDWFHKWPLDALLEVADKYLSNMSLGSAEQDKLKPSLAQVFGTVHSSVSLFSARMLNEMHRHNYVTPTNYLELVSGYKRLYREKEKELGDEANKLKNGLFKIDDTREKVQNMSVELEEANINVMAFQKECDKFISLLVAQKQEADEQQKAVSVQSARIREEGKKCQEIADSAQHDLDAALPALQAAVEALESLNKKDMTEIKSYGKPPAMVEKVMQAVMILRNSDPSWAEAKKQLGEANFLKDLMNYDKDNITDKVLKKIGKYCDQADFVPEVIGRVSTAAKSLCMWVRAMEEYGRIFRIVEPKRQRLYKAMATLKEKQDMLAEAMAKLKELEDKLELLKKEYDEKLMMKADLQRKAAHMALMMERARRLVEGLAGERLRWLDTVEELENQMGYLPGDCMIAAAFLSYLGPFLSEYREEIVNKVWISEIRTLAIPCTPSFSFTDFMVRPTQVRDWNIQGLPSDSFSTENGIIVTQGNRWPLMVDPQCQAIKWIKNMEGSKGLRIIDLQQSDYMHILEHSIQMGIPVLLQNVQEVLDPSLDPVLTKSLVKVGNAYIMKLGDKEVEYNPEFHFYITTRMSNPHYTPEISTKTAIVNFAVKEQGLEAQLLAVVVGKERPDLEEMKDSLVRGIAAGRKKLKDLENEILRLLNETKGSLLEDETLLNTLETSKVTSHDVGEQLATAETTEVKIDAAREGYRDSSKRSAILFFVLNDMGHIDPMYQFSLDAYIDLFILSIDKSPKSSDLEERIAQLNEYHTYAVYRYTCRALFEKHKLLFSFHMCAKVLESGGKLCMDEYTFFLRGGVVLDRDNQMDNPCSWLSDLAWDNITELDKLTNFHDIITSFEQYGREWYEWFTSDNPETAFLPGEWENSCNELQRMLLVRSLRPDRVSFCVTSFIVNNMGVKFTEPPVLNMQQVLEDSTCKTPLIFVLSPGVDPTAGLMQLSQAKGFGERFSALSLGQGQTPVATRLLRDGVRDGKWVFLANCHLSLSWMPALDKLVGQLQVQAPHPDFRLWLSSSPSPDFPISILQQAIKMTTEPPKGLRANMKRLYTKISETKFLQCKTREKYIRLLYCLCFFHSVLLERKKFLMLGWNIGYEFNDSDFEVSENLLQIYLDAYEETPWESLRYLIAGISYGGHVTDDWDRRLLMTYMGQYFCERVLEVSLYPLSILPTYFVPIDGPYNIYLDHIHFLPAIDHPEAFGQHPNADITSQIQEAKCLFDTLLSLAPQQTSGGAGESREDKVLELAANIFKQIPENIDFAATAKLLSVDPCPLNVVLLQEIQRYNALLVDIRISLIDLEKGIQGLVVMTADLEIIFNCLFDGRVPPSWEKAYSSLKPLAAWTRDLVMRMDQMSKWALTAHQPTIFWMSGFTFPTGFLTAVLQTYARKNNITFYEQVSIDLLSWDFSVLTVDDSNVPGQPKEGVLVKGMFLQGAGWDMKNQMLIEAAPMQLVCPMPSIHFKPSEAKKKSSKGIYTAPCYYTPNRAGSAGHPSFVVAVDLKTGEKPPEHWIKRGTALLMSLDY